MNLIRPRAHKTAVIRDDDGQLSGFRTEHWDDHVDGLVLPGSSQPAFLTDQEKQIVKKLIGAGE